MKPASIGLALLAAAGAMTGCEREARDLTPSLTRPAADPTRAGNVLAGGSAPLQPGPRAGRDPLRADHKAFDVNQGKRLFRWYNCNGCHAGGGGGMGPPLMDAEWRYGHEPQHIHASIVQGRPGGMPAFGGRIPDDQVWQLVAYVRSLSGQLRKDVAPSRGDAMAGAPPENARDTEKPVPAASAPGRP